MITRLQDEAHRFAIEYHRSLRSKSQIHSVLDDIEGIGPARRKALLAYFKDIDKIRAASIADLEIPQGMNNTALNILNADDAYYFTIDSFNGAGVTKGKEIKIVQ